jgi:hypothetical protein
MKSTIYIVVAISGEYDSYNERIVRAFTTEPLAESFIKEIHKYNDELFAKYKLPKKDSSWQGETADIPDGTNLMDSYVEGMQHSNDLPVYEYYEVEMEDGK